jgi:hypothetical protein
MIRTSRPASDAVRGSASQQLWFVEPRAVQGPVGRRARVRDVGARPARPVRACARPWAPGCSRDPRREPHSPSAGGSPTRSLHPVPRQSAACRGADELDGALLDLDPPLREIPHHQIRHTLNLEQALVRRSPTSPGAAVRGPPPGTPRRSPTCAHVARGRRAACTDPERASCSRSRHVCATAYPRLATCDGDTTRRYPSTRSRSVACHQRAASST